MNGARLKTVGVIAEYNPFHSGHAFQLDYIRKTFHARFIVVAISGDFVQRGAPALFPKHLRTRMALLQGADLVLELPVSTATASAEAFARGGVSLFDGLGVVNALCFGSECGDICLLQALAELLVKEPALFSHALQEALKTGMTYPAARCRALLSCLDNLCFPLDKSTGKNLLFRSREELEALLSSPNNILGVEYCKALLRQKSSIQPVTLRRQGSGYHEKTLPGKDFPSASAIRKYLCGPKKKSSLSPLSGLIPRELIPLLETAMNQRSFLTPEDFNPLFLYSLIKETPDTLCQYLDISPDLACRIYGRRFSFQDFSQFTSLLKTKELTRTRLQRALLHMVLGIKKAPSSVPYARILGFRRDSASLLGEIKKKGTIPLLAKAADAKKLLDPEALGLFEETVFASNLYQSLLSQKTGQPFCHEYSQPMVIL